LWLLLENHDPVFNFEQDVFHLRVLSLTEPLLDEKVALDVEHVVTDGAEEEAHQTDLEDNVSHRRGIQVTFKLMLGNLVLHEVLGDESHDACRNGVGEPLCARQGNTDAKGQHSVVSHCDD